MHQQVRFTLQRQMIMLVPFTALNVFAIQGCLHQPTPASLEGSQLIQDFDHCIQRQSNYRDGYPKKRQFSF